MSRETHNREHPLPMVQLEILAEPENDRYKTSQTQTVSILKPAQNKSGDISFEDVRICFLGAFLVWPFLFSQDDI